MKIIDANIVLRFLLNDNVKLSSKAENIILNNKVTLLVEIVAEIIYVLNGVYGVPRKEIVEILIKFEKLDTVSFEKKDVIIESLFNYSTYNLDFVDCVLIAYNSIYKHEIFTFDKKLIKKLIS